MANSFRYSKARSNGRHGRFADRLNPSRFRYLTDIVALTIAILGIEILFGTLYTRQLLMHNSSTTLAAGCWRFLSRASWCDCVAKHLPKSRKGGPLIGRWRLPLVSELPHFFRPGWQRACCKASFLGLFTLPKSAWNRDNRNVWFHCRSRARRVCAESLANDNCTSRL